MPRVNSDLRTPGCRHAQARALCGVLLAAAFGLASGCDGLLGVNQAQCDQSIATFRQAISFEQFDSAEQWRNYTWKVCRDEATLAVLDGELLKARTAKVEKEAAEAKRIREVAQSRINSAQSLWLAFDARDRKSRTLQALNATKKSAARQLQNLPEDLARQLTQYNAKQYAKRQALLKR